MNWLNPRSSSLSSGESSVSHKRQLPYADAKLLWLALSALPEQWVAGNCYVGVSTDVEGSFGRPAHPMRMCSHQKAHTGHLSG